MSLTEYARKRNFQRTAEPPPREEPSTGSRFVIQKHAATRLHYDFRLELDGTLKSWAVPKGLPYEHGEKRLAVQTEDHPLSYINFEGTIPPGEYGGGTVMVWDRGTFEAETKSPLEDLARGKLHVVLHGEKLRGAWHLVRLRDAEADKPQWLVIRGGESMRPGSKKADDLSVRSGQTMAQLARSGDVWRSHKPAARPSAEPRRPRSRTARLPEFIEPMRARAVDAPPRTGGWLYEIKFDGYRALGLRGGTEAAVFSRNAKDLGAKFPDVRDALLRIDAREAIVDGEIVALDAEGRSSFQLLQAYDVGEEKPPIFYYAFDLLRWDGDDLRDRPLEERKAALARILPPDDPVIRHSAALGSDVGSLLEHARALGLEGLIGKRSASCYEAGKRSGAWIKLKLLHEQEFVIGGFTNPEGSRQHLGALLVGVYEGNRLRYCGKVGTGFTQKSLAATHAELAARHREGCPFPDLPEKRSSRYGQAITAAEMRRCHWVEPAVVCQVRFTEWTRDHHLRHPVFLGLRRDKDPREIVREEGIT